MDIREKAAYVKGMLDGLGLDKDEKQVQLLNAIIDLLQDMAQEVSDLEQCYDDVCDQVDALDETVADIADELEDGWTFEDDEDDEDIEYEFTCPTCNKTSYVDESFFESETITCPSCGEELDFDFADDEEAPSESEA